MYSVQYDNTVTCESSSVISGGRGVGGKQVGRPRAASLSSMMGARIRRMMEMHRGASVSAIGDVDGLRALELAVQIMGARRRLSSPAC